jgi:hypothetical protein
MDKRTFSGEHSQVTASRFALIYFRPEQTSSRGLCANEGWGDAIKTVGNNFTITKTATLNQIVFQNRVPPLSWEGSGIINTGQCYKFQ